MHWSGVSSHGRLSVFIQVAERRKNVLGKMRNVRFPNLLVLPLSLANRTDSAQKSWGL